ncbi:MAG: hypothetical protein U9N37_02720 [Thermodesulfobacteriota bacterium]|nr:hypothetical protein [Thermodesulfobacteriota bacterium]
MIFSITLSREIVLISDDSHFPKSVDQERAHILMHLPAPYPNLAAIANKISSVISRIMIAEEITAFIATRIDDHAEM